MDRDLQQPTLSVSDLTVGFRTASGLRRVIEKVSFSIYAGENVGFVGESGSGKSVTMLAAMGLLPSTAKIEAAHIRIKGEDLHAATEARLAEFRGSEISMVFQNPMTSLNPSMSIGRQVSEVVEIRNPRMPKAELDKLAVRMLTEVGIPNPQLRISQYPHEFSGGMRQRAVIAMSLVGEPSVLVADEPTTALDVTVQAQIISLMRDLSARHNVASIIITHDLDLIAELVDRVMVMYAGRIVEETPVAGLFDRPAHPYTQALLESRPSIGRSRDRLLTIPGLPPQSADAVPGCPFHPRCRFAGDHEICRTETPELVRYEPGRASACHFLDEVLSAGPRDGGRTSVAGKAVAKDEPEVVLTIKDVFKTYGPVRALDGVDLELRRGETLGIAGESGCGKSTLARVAMGLVRPTGGQVLVKGRDISSLKGRALREARRDIQMVFQDPTSSLDRRLTIRRIIAEPMEIAGLPKEQIEARIAELMKEVSLPDLYLDRFPNELSGGQRQRVGIARALALNPEVVLLDEPTSALDVSVQAQIVNLLSDLRSAGRAGYIFIAHDLGVLRHVSDRVMVMYLGRVVEAGRCDVVFTNPRHPYSRALLSSAPATHPSLRSRERFVIKGAPSDSANIPSGCGFRGRCPLATDICAAERPELAILSDDGHRAACHFANDPEKIETIPSLADKAG